MGPYRTKDDGTEPDEKPHASRSYDAELRELRAHTLAMGARCERSVSLALEAWWKGDPGIVADVAALDAQIDRDQMDIDALAIRILGCREPLGGDLRFVATALRLVTDLERIGDEAFSIARRAGLAFAETPLVSDQLTGIAERACEMLRTALRCFVDKDDEGAVRILPQDDEVDRLYRAVIEQMSDHMMQRPSDVPIGINIVQVAKSLERIADHATNIAEAVIFMFRGDDVRRGRPPLPNASND